MLKRIFGSCLLLSLMTFIILAFSGRVVADQGLSTGTSIEKSLPGITEEPTVENMRKIKDESVSIVQDWKELAKVINFEGLSFETILKICTLLYISLFLLGIALIVLAEFIKIFTPKEIDIKLDVFIVGVRAYLIEWPAEILSQLRSKVRKDKTKERLNNVPIKD